MKFKVNDRVALSEECSRHNAYAPSKLYPAGREAVVVGQSKTKDCSRIIFDGQKTVNTYHNSFLTKVAS